MCAEAGESDTRGICRKRGERRADRRRDRFVQVERAVSDFRSIARISKFIGVRLGGFMLEGPTTLSLREMGQRTLGESTTQPAEYPLRRKEQVRKTEIETKKFIRENQGKTSLIVSDIPHTCPCSINRTIYSTVLYM